MDSSFNMLVLFVSRRCVRIPGTAIGSEEANTSTNRPTPDHHRRADVTRSTHSLTLRACIFRNVTKSICVTQIGWLAIASDKALPKRHAAKPFH